MASLHHKTAILIGLSTLVVAANACYRPVGAANPGAVVCQGPDTGPTERWQHRVRSSAIATLLGDPHHSASDPVINPGQAATAEGKFAYGTVSKDLEGEQVELWLQMSPCGEWQAITKGLTQSDGRIALTVPSRYIPKTGTYGYQLIVRGDLSAAAGVIYVVPKRTRVVLFDIDGTLTTSDMELVSQIALGSDPEMRPGANEVARLYARAGYLPIYLSGRPYMFRAASKDWLRRHGFPPGILLTTPDLAAAMPSPHGVGRFKRDQLRQLAAHAGLSVAYAYGNATTDICAYAQAGITPGATYIVGKHRGQACPGHEATRSVSDYRLHYEKLKTLSL